MMRLLAGTLALAHLLFCISVDAQTTNTTRLWKAVQLQAKEWITCALLEGGFAKCWGHGGFGQLGQGEKEHRGASRFGMGDNLQPIRLRAPVAQVAVGAWHVCFLFVNGSVSCIGDFREGRGGYESTKEYGGTPDTLGDGLPLVNLGTGKTATYLSAGWHHTCAILNDGSLRCWGTNSFAQLGDGSFNHRGDEPGEMGDNLPPVQLPPGRRAVNVSAGGEHTCVLLDDQTVRCFGKNDFRQLGIGSTADTWGGSVDQMGAALPLVDVGGPVAQVSAGAAHTCVLLVSGAVKCFGAQNNLELGTSEVPGAPVGGSPSDMGFNLKPVILAGSGVVQISAGRPNSCARFANGEVVCWGTNQHGQLGVDDTSSRWAGNLTAVKLGAAAAHVSASGWMRICALLVTGQVKCWGLNDVSGALGIGTTSDRGGSPGDMEALPAVDLGTQPLPTSMAPPARSAAPLIRSTLEPQSTMNSKVEVPVGAIVGGVVGGLVLLAAVILAAVLLVRRRAKADRTQPPVYLLPPESSDTVPLNPGKDRSTQPLSPTAQYDYDWITPRDLQSSGVRPNLQAGINDVDLDAAREWIPGTGWHSTVKVLNSAEVKQQIKLVAGKPLGTGACGQVFMCVWESRFPGALLAAKVMRNEHPDVLKSFAYEAQLLAAIRHPNIVRTYGYCLQPPNVCIIMELLQGSVGDVLRTVMSSTQSSTGGKTGFSVPSSIAQPSSGANSTSVVGKATVYDSPADTTHYETVDAATHVVVNIAKPKQSTLANAPSAFSAISPGSDVPSQHPAASMLSMTDVLRISLDVAYGLEYLHDMNVPVSIRRAQQEGPIDEEAADVGGGAQSGVLHRDLKPANILLNINKQAKICDFGIARRVQATALHTEVEWAGTSSYMAPELLAVKTNKGMRGMVTRKVDIYSLAIIMSELLCHSRAFVRPEQVASGIRPLLPTANDPDTDWRADCLARLQCRPQVLDNMIGLIEACWHHRLEKRPTAAEVRVRLSDLKQQHESQLS